MTGLVRSVLRGATLRCPACGRRTMWSSPVAMRDSCPSCGVRFEPARGEATGAVMFGQGVLGMVALMGWFFLRIGGAPAWLSLGWLLAFAASPLFLYPALKGAWVGFLHGTRGLTR